MCQPRGRLLPATGGDAAGEGGGVGDLRPRTSTSNRCKIESRRGSGRCAWVRGGYWEGNGEAAFTDGAEIGRRRLHGGGSSASDSATALRRS
jgi:hypothetical protein